MSYMWQRIHPERLSLDATFVKQQAEQAAAAASLDERLEKIRALEEEVAALRREQANLHRGIFEAAQIQRRLCGPRQIGVGEFEVAGEIFPVRHLSGDFFKVMELDSALGIAIGDIAGKGLSAGIWLPHLVSLIYGCARTHQNPAETIEEVNREICAGYGEPPLVALFFARIDLRNGEVVYCNAGLPSPLILGRGNEIASLDVGGPMLGATLSGIFKTGTVTLKHGDTLVACTDGVTECQNSQGEEFELKRLSTAVRAASGGSASQTVFSALGAALDFADGCPTNDDLTLVVVRREEKMAAPDRSCGPDSSAVTGGKVSVMPFRGARRSGMVS